MDELCIKYPITEKNVEILRALASNEVARMTALTQYGVAFETIRTLMAAPDGKWSQELRKIYRSKGWL